LHDTLEAAAEVGVVVKAAVKGDGRDGFIAFL
jgi:hypothetical protein